MPLTRQPTNPALHRLRRAVFAAVVLTTSASCSASTATDPSPFSPARPAVELSLTQVLPEEGSRHALLRVINPGSRSLEVTAVGLAWDGYGEVLQPTNASKEVPADDQLMLRFELPPPRCDDDADGPDDEVRGLITVDGVDVEQELTGPAQRYVRRLWRTQCDELLVERAVALEWRLAPGPVQQSRVGTELSLSRRGGTDRIAVVGTDGSVLYRLSRPGRAVLLPGEESVTVPLAVLPGNRCDEHAIGQATAPYDFSITLQVGSRRVRQALAPPLSIQNAASRMLLRHCGSEPEGG